MRVLCLFHRVPFPPDKGEKLRGFHLLAALAERFALEIGAFFDEGEEAEAEAFLARHAERWRLVPLGRGRPLLRGGMAMAAGGALSAGYFHDRQLGRFVEEACERGVEAAYVFSGPMAQYVCDHRGRARMPFLLDLVDVDSAKWAALARRRPFPVGPLYALEGRRLAAFEGRAAAAAGLVTLVTQAEATLFRRLHPDIPAERVAVLENGVDTGFFVPRPRRPGGAPALIFTGRMDYAPNVEGICWFVHHVWPGLVARHPQLRLLVVGAEPVRAVRRLARDPRITVTGRVPDVRPFYEEADIAIVPLMTARGIQNKILEAMAMAMPVVASPAAFEGLDPGACDVLTVAPAEPASWVAAVDALLRNPDRRRMQGQQARDFVRGRYGWAQQGRRLAEMIAGLAAGCRMGEASS